MKKEYQTLCRVRIMGPRREHREAFVWCTENGYRVFDVYHPNSTTFAIEAEKVTKAYGAKK